MDTGSVKETEVRREVEGLKREVENCHKQYVELETRLTGILNTMKSPIKDAKSINKQLVPLAEELHSILLQLITLRDNLGNLRNRIEL